MPRCYFSFVYFFKGIPETNSVFMLPRQAWAISLSLKPICFLNTNAATWQSGNEMVIT